MTRYDRAFDGCEFDPEIMRPVRSGEIHRRNVHHAEAGRHARLGCRL
jgi:hypothetical protein